VIEGRYNRSIVKPNPLGLFAIAFVVFGCAPKIKDADLVGTWKRDRAPAASASNDEKAESQMTFDLQADHKYVMKAPYDISLKGDWSYENHEVTLTPSTMTMKFGGMKAETKPVGEMIKMLTDLANQTQASASDIKDMQSLGEPQIIKVDQDGKSLHFEGMTLIKG